MKVGNFADVESEADEIQGSFRKAVRYPQSDAGEEVKNFQTVRPALGDDGLLTLLLDQGVAVNAKPLEQGRPWWETLLVLFWFNPAAGGAVRAAREQRRRPGRSRRPGPLSGQALGALGAAHNVRRRGRARTRPGRCEARAAGSGGQDRRRARREESGAAGVKLAPASRELAPVQSPGTPLRAIRRCPMKHVLTGAGSAEITTTDERTRATAGWEPYGREARGSGRAESTSSGAQTGPAASVIGIATACCIAPLKGYADWAYDIETVGAAYDGNAAPNVTPAVAREVADARGARLPAGSPVGFCGPSPRCR